MKFEKNFFKEIYRNTGGFFPTWPLGKQVKLGDIVSIKHKRMDYLGTLADPELNISIETQEDQTADETKWQSQKNISTTFKARGEVQANSSIPVGKAGLIIEFGKKGGFLFQPSGVKYHRIKNMIEVRKKALDLITYELLGTRNVYIVKQVAQVDSYALAISSSSSGKLEVTAESADKVSLGDLASVDLGLSVSRSESLGFSVVGSNGGELFYKAEKLALKPEAMDDIWNNFDHSQNLNMDSLKSLVPAKSIADGKADNFFHFVPADLDDIDTLLGD